MGAITGQPGRNTQMLDRLPSLALAYEEEMKTKVEAGKRALAEHQRQQRISNAAFDLFAACEQIEALIDKHGIGDDDHESEPVVAALKVALKKARG